MLCSTSLRCALNLLKQFQRTISSAPTIAVPSDKLTGDDAQPGSDISKVAERGGEGLTLNEKKQRKNNDAKNQLVSAAFTSLRHSLPQPPPKSSLEESILNSKTPEELLVISQSANINRKQALRIVTTLAEWSVNGQADMSKFESDPRFIALCQLLGRGSSTTTNQTITKHGDLSVVLGVTGDDEAAKLISTITLPQMIKVLSSLGFKKRRSIPLLRSLSFNIAQTPIKLDIKQSADILYSLALLNFPDEVLLEKVCSDVSECISVCKKSSVIGSISTSLGLLRYKDTELLDLLSEWVLSNQINCRSQDIVSLLLTLASVNHIPSIEDKFFEALVPSLTVTDLHSALEWLDFVWSIAVLGHANAQHFSYTLSKQFINRVSAAQSSNDNNVSWKRKLLNINGIAKWTKGYTGPLLDEETEGNIPFVRTKEKQLLVNSVFDALSNLLPSTNFLRTNVNTGMGFIIDGECVIDVKMTPLPLVDKKTGHSVNNHTKALKIAIMVWDYHDNTRGRITLTGSSSLSKTLLERMGYKVLNVHHSEYCVKDKLTQRVQYLEKQIKSLIQSSN